MGFPQWTLWGMGLSVFGALIAITLSWLGQSPKLLRRIGLTSLRLDLRIRAFTGYALALLLLATAFFLAGVPLGGSTADNGIVAQETSEATSGEAALTTTPDSAVADISPEPDSLNPTPATPETGAFSGPPTTEADSESTLEEGGITSEPIRATSPVTATATVPAASAPDDSTVTPTETPTPLPTATPQPTETPLPTLTPTAIVGPTAIVNSDGSTLWLRRSPGGQNTVLVQDGDLVLLLSGRANQGGMLWREVATVEGVEGWLRQEFLVPSDS